MRIVLALGGNALLRRGEPLDAATQRANVAAAAKAIAAIGGSHELVITHGNGPQVGLLALQAAAYAEFDPYPLDVLGAESEGMIGYLLEQALEGALPGRSVATLLTQTVVSADDPAFAAPKKPIGPVYDEPTARHLAAERGWTVDADGEGFRRVVASPQPRRIVELAAIRLLVEAGVLVVCSGGGGVPVIVGPDGAARGVEAVVDKDLAASLLATELGADLLLIATDVDGVFADWGAPGERLIAAATPAELRGLELSPGSMGPKARACAAFVEATRRRAAICRWDALAAAVAGRAGTQVTAG